MPDGGAGHGAVRSFQGRVLGRTHGGSTRGRSISGRSTEERGTL
ncbi:hypothetical protein FM103_15290 [Corynebacterium xerosis]|nr:hypothetical protein FM103_15290 [Corynebacterium xerosis]